MSDDQSTVEETAGGQPPVVEPAEEAPKPKRKKTLDREKKFSTIHGGQSAAKYLQDGKYFDSQGQQCEGP